MISIFIKDKKVSINNIVYINAVKVKGFEISDFDALLFNFAINLYVNNIPNKIDWNIIILKLRLPIKLDNIVSIIKKVNANIKGLNNLNDLKILKIEFILKENLKWITLYLISLIKYNKEDFLLKLFLIRIKYKITEIDVEINIVNKIFSYVNERLE